VSKKSESRESYCSKESGENQVKKNVQKEENDCSKEKLIDPDPEKISNKNADAVNTSPVAENKKSRKKKKKKKNKKTEEKMAEVTDQPAHIISSKESEEISFICNIEGG
jgi:hypothetical protein